MRQRLILPLITAVILLTHAEAIRGQVRVEAAAGEPFGVASITMPVGPHTAEALTLNELEIRDDGRRAVYPAFGTGRVRQVLGGLLGNDQALGGPQQLTVLFLFKGRDPFSLTVYTPSPVNVAVQPRVLPRRGFDRLMLRWWRQYHANARQQQQEGDYSPIVETYLTSMLSRRTGLAPPLLSRASEKTPNEPLQTLELLMGLEGLRLATMRSSMQGAADDREAANLPVPDPIRWGEEIAVNFAPNVAVEPIAMHVPEECFYIRFGSFANYLWMNKLLEEYGGDLSSMITLRGNNPQLSQRMQTQLALELNLASELFGDQVIRDVVLLGTDLYLSEGAALGVLFQAKNTAVLKLNLAGQRKTFLQRFQQQGASITTVRIAEQDVSFLATPDNQLRSFYVSDGDYHLVTTSRHIAQRFLEASSGKQPLGASSQFKHARTLMPLTREDTIFAYFSSAFLRGLVSPQYQIELGRRLRATTDLELVMLARLAGRAENVPAETIEDLVAQGLLPLGFSKRPDQSGPILEPKRVLDSLRGRRGAFLPIPDVPLRGVTATEATSYARRAAFYSQQWTQMDPLMAGIKRYALDQQGRERIVIDAHVSPFGEQRYGWITSLVGPPNNEKITPAPGDIITVQAMLRGGLLSPSVPPHHIFLGIQDMAPLPSQGPGGLLETLRLLQSTPGYLGAWPKPGFLDWLPLRLAGQPDAQGFSQLPFGLLRWQGGGFSVLSFDRRVLDTVTPHLRPATTDDTAQIRVHAGDLAASKLAPWVRMLAYQRANQASVGNVRLLNTLTQQLNVAREESLRTVETLLDTQLICSLGGKYQLAEQNGDMYWKSDQWAANGADYDAPILRWFRGLDAGLTKYGDQLVVRTTIDMQRQPDEPAVQLPLFNLFGSGGKKDPPEKK